jgi:hypothetical protein
MTPNIYKRTDDIDIEIREQGVSYEAIGIEKHQQFMLCGMLFTRAMKTTR